MDTYEEVLRRNEPKNYTVKWRMADGTVESAVYFPSFEEADLFADNVRARDYVEDIQILRSGRHPSSKTWTPTRREAKPRATRTGGVVINEEAWKLPAGYVDGDADKHGPVVFVATQNRLPVRSNAEKAEWARKNTFETRMLGVW